jgi:hypothetical protein
VDYLPAGFPRAITRAIKIDFSGRKEYQEVGYLILRCSVPNVVNELIDHFHLVSCPSDS